MTKTTQHLRHLLGEGTPHIRAVPITVLGGLAVALAALLLLLPSSKEPATRDGDFLRSALGAPTPAAPLVRRPSPGVTVRFREAGLTVERGEKTIELAPLAGATGPWSRFARGVSRPTAFGRETITVTPGHAEHFLTVDRHVGRRTWRWELTTLDLRPRVGHDGAVAFLDGPRLSSLTIPPPLVFDRSGNDVTPAGAHWALENVERRTYLTLALDDAELPLPYVIDPAITYDATTEAAAAAANSNTITVTRPVGVRENDVVVVHLAHRLGTGGNVSAVPAGWTLLLTDDNNVTIEQDTYWRKVGPLASEPASYAWTLSANTQWVAGAAAFSGIDGAAPSDVNGAFGNATTAAVSAPAIAGGVNAGSVVLGHFSLGAGVAGTVDWTTAGGWAEIFDHQSASGTVNNRVSSATYYTTQGVAGGTAAQTATCGGCAARRNIGVQTALRYDATAPTGVTVTAPATARGTVALSGTATETGSSLDVQFQGSPAGAGTWTNIGPVQTSAPYSVTYDTTIAPDGFYDVRVLATNGAGDSTASAVAVVRVDNSSPDQNPLTLTELTGPALQYWDSTNRIHYYNPTGAGGTFSLSSAPRDVQNAITFVGGSSGANNNSPLTLNVPAGVQAGDLLLAQVGYERTMAISVPTPAGWTRHVDRDNGTIYGQVIFYRWATASEPASYTIPHASGAASIAGTLVAYRGVASVSPVMANNGTVANGATLTAPSVTTPAACGRLVAFYGLWNTATLSTPTGMTARATAINTEAGWNSRVLAADEILGAAGATGSRISTATVTATNSTGPGSNVSELVALRPNVCVASVDYLAPGQTGFTGGGNLDTVEPYAASPDYAFTSANVTEPGAKTITVADEAGNPVLTTSITFRRDVTPPSYVASPSITSGFTNSTTIPVTDATATDTGGAGVDASTSILERESGTLLAGSCTWTGIWSAVTLVGGNDTGVTATCYRYRNKVTDNVSNQGTSPVSGAVMVDTGAPTPGTVSVAESAAGSHASGSTLFYRPAGAGGSFDVTVTSPSDGLSGIAKIAFPGLAGGFSPAGALDDTGSPYTRSYSWSTGATASGGQTVTAHDGAGNTATATFTLTQDSTAPAGHSVAPASVPPSGFYSTATIDLTPTDGSDGGAGLDTSSRVFERESGVLAAGACSSWSGTWTTVSDPDTAPASGCYRYRLLISDNVGNQSAPSAASVAVMVDLTDPATGAVTVTESNADTHGSGSILFYRPAGAGGSFTVAAASTDAHSGVEKVAFPGLASGFAPGAALDDTVGPYSRSYTVSTGASDSGAKTVTVTDRSGRTATGSFTLTSDSAAPTTTDDTGAIGGGWKTANQTVTLSPSDGSSGTATTYYTTDGSAPTLASAQGTSVALTTDGLHVVRYFSVDNVGNQEAAQTAGTTIRIDKTPPGSATLDPVPARIRNGQVLTGAGADATSGVSTLTYLNCAGAACTPATTIGSSSTVAGGYPVTWNAQPADGTYTLAVRVTDVAGHTLDSSTRTVVVDNTAPVVASADVSGSTLELTFDEPLDPGTPVATAFVVKKNGIAQATPTNVSVAGSVVTLTLAAAVVHSDAVTVAYTAPGAGTVLGDVAGNPASSFGDSAAANSTPNVVPTATVALSPAVVRTNDTLTATATRNDADGDPVTLTYVWKVNGAVVKTTAATASLTDALDLSQAGNGDKGQTVSVEVTPNDGIGDGALVSDSKVVANSAPTATVALSPTPPRTDDTLTASATRGDVDADTVTLTYVWKVNGVVRKTTAGSSSLTDTFDLSLAGNGTSGDTIVVEVTPEDGTMSGTTVTDSTTVLSGVFAPGTAAGIAGTARVGEVLTRVAAGWTPAPDSRSYQWRRCDAAGASCADLAGETGTTYTLTPADLGATIRVVETASRADYIDASSTSAASGVIANGLLSPGSPAGVNGTPAVGEVLTRIQATWTPAPDARTYQWRRCDAAGGGCVDIGGETGTSYTLAAADLGRTIRVVETATKTAYSNATSTSTQTALVTAGDFTNTAPVSITGTAKVGATLTRTAGNWTPTPTSRLYQWRRCDASGGNCNDIAGESNTFYILAPADLGQTIRVVETVNRAGFNTASSTSAQSAVVVPADLTNIGPGSITGTAKVGEVLTRSTATWSPAPDTRSYQWRRCDAGGGSCADLGGETGTSYTLVAADLGQTIRVVETASKTGYNDASSTSPQTAAVALGDFTATTPVSITGTVAVGEVLTRAAATWTPAPDTRSYQWRRCDAGGGSCADLAGETGTTYTLVEADFGQTIRVVETATKTAYNNATSTSTQTVAVGPGTISNTAVPTVTGTPTVTFTLTATGGSWTPGGTSSAFQWVRCEADGTGCADLPGEVAATYVVVSADLGKKLKVRETASKAAYTNASADSALTAVVSDIDLTPPTNTITLGSPVGAYLSGTTIYYRPSAAGSFTLSSAVADTGVGPASATYPPVSQFAWSHGGETVSTPAGGPYVSSSFSWTGVASGTFAYGVTAADAWSPANTSLTTLSITEDSDAPSSNALCGGGACSTGWYTTSPVAVTLSSSDGGAGVDLIRYTTDGTTPTLLTGSTYMGAIPVAAEGTTTMSYRAYDRVGNEEPVQTQLIRIDTVVPDTTIDSGPSGATNVTSAAFTFSSGDGSASFECRLLPGGSWAACASPQTFTSLADGSYTFEVRAADPPGNVDGSPATLTWTVDTVSADTTITSAPAPDTTDTTASFSFTASDAGPTFECRIDGAAFAACSSPKSYAGLTEGAHAFEVRAVDAAGNADATPATHAWTVDTTAPDTTIPVTPADPSSNTTPTFGFGSSQTPATYACNLDGAGWSACPSPHAISPALSDGPHTLDVRSTDAAGNTDATPASFTWVVDATAPIGSLTSPPDGSAVSGTVALGSSSADVGGSGVMHALFEVAAAGSGSWTAVGPPDTTAPYSALLDTTPLADGDHDLRVTTRDNAGNSTVSTMRTVTVDNTLPTLSASAPNPVNLTSPDPETITATASDTGTGVSAVSFEQCNETSAACDSDAWTSLGVDTTSPYSAVWPIPTDGTRLLRVRATDGAGRQRTELILTTVDRTAPSGTLTTPVAAANLSGSAAVAATATDSAPGGVNSVEFQITTQGSPYSAASFASDTSGPSYDATLDTTAHADGLYDLRAFVSDVNGNSTASPRVTVRLDNTAPTGSVTTPADAADLRGTVTLTSDSADTGSGVDTVQFQRSPAGAGTWTNQTASWDTIGVADGQYDLRVITTDNAGGSLTSPTITIRVDNTAPTGSVTTPADAADLRGTVTLTSDSADTGSGVDTVQFQRSPAGAGTWTNQTASWDTIGVADGQYDLRVITTDNAGGSLTSPKITIRVDNTAPTGSVTAPAAGAEIGVPPATLTSDSADPLTGGSASGVATVVFERRPAGGGAWTATPSSWDTASGPEAVTDGAYELRVTTTDVAGNSFTSSAVTVLVDHTAPLSTASLSPGSPSNAPVTVSFSASDGTGSGVAQSVYRVDGGSVVAGSSVVLSAPSSHANDGSHLIEFFSTDDVGNVESTKSITVVIDTTAPSGTAGDPGSYLRGIAQLAYSSPDLDVSSVQFQFSPAGANAWASIGAADMTSPYEASWNTGTVTDGAYDLRAVVTDSVGNVDNTLLPGLPKYVDNAAPAGFVTSPAAAAVVAGNVDVTASATDGASPPASGVSAVRFEIKPAGAGSFSPFGTEAVPVVGTTYRRSLDTTAFADGPAELHVVVTDVAGNETTSAAVTVTTDNVVPTITLDNPGAAVSGTPTLSATAAADTASVVFERRPAGGGAWTTIDTDATPGDGFTAAWATGPVTDGLYELHARATDGGGNVGASALRTVRVDNELPTGTITSPAPSTNVGGPAVAIAATAADTGSGVATVEFIVKVQGSSTYATISTDTSAPYEALWDATAAPDGTAELRLVITDAAGNQRQSSVVPVSVDSTAPSVTLDDPGATLSGTASLTATAAGGAARVVFGISPAGSGSWTQLADDPTAPFAAAFDTSGLADGLYDLRAIGYDAFGNVSVPAVRSGIRFDNTAPTLVSSAPQDGSVSAAVTEILLTASEAVVATGVLLDGFPAPAPTIYGSTLTFSTGALSQGLHVLSGRLQDASGSSTPFRVAVTVESTPGADRPPVERSASPTGQTVVTSAGALATADLGASAWPTRPTAEDFIVVRVDPTLPLPLVAPRLAPGTDVIEVTARWALAGTQVTQFQAPIAITIPHGGGAAVVPAVSQDATSWRALPLLANGTLPAGQQDGFYRDAGGVHVLTRHLTYFALLGDVQPPTPPHHTAGVVLDGDGLTLRWIPGTDDSGELGQVILYVNGESYGLFDPTQFETKLGPFTPDDTRTFSFVQVDAAGNRSEHSPVLRGVPAIVGGGLEQARTLLAARGFGVGALTYELGSGAAPGTVLAYEGDALRVEGTKLGLRIAGTPPQTKLAFDVAIAKRLVVGGPQTVGARVRTTRPADLTATLVSPRGRVLHTWSYSVRAGVTIVKLPFSLKLQKPGVHRLVWVVRSGSTTTRKSLALHLMRPFWRRPVVKRLQVVVVATRPLRGALPSTVGVLARTGLEEAYSLSSSRQRDVRVVVVDVDVFGIRFLRDMRQVFPYMRLVAVASDPGKLRRAKAAGASVTLLRDRVGRSLAYKILGR